MMKKVLVFLAVVALVSSAPQPRKLFHEHVEDFIDIIDESSEELARLMEIYSEFDEFWKSIDYMKTNNFKEIIYEMESLPEFVAVIDFLENDNIDVHFFIDMLNGILENVDVDTKSLARQSVSGRDLTSFTRDCIAVFPKEKLAALFDQKMAEDEEFRTAIQNLESEEWESVFSALWESEVFQAEVAALSENGIEISVLFEQLLAIFGQNYEFSPDRYGDNTRLMSADMSIKVRQRRGTTPNVTGDTCHRTFGHSRSSSFILSYSIKRIGTAVSVSQNSGNDTRMMKQALVVLALVALAFSAPQTRKLFHEHVEDFLDIIMDEAGHEIEHLNEHYLEYDEFWTALDYMRTNNFKDLVYEMESLPEFVAVIEFLEQDNIDIHYFIDLFNEMIESIQQTARSARHSTSGRDFTSFMRDCIDAFPKAKLSALFEQKMAEDEEFRTAINNLNSEQWDAVFSALWANPTFQAEVATLAENGIDVKVFLDEIVAVFGQN
ncbi:uncharacterized protein LOC126910976 [Spodoptera frugiperda]|uniref:Uncharacterized protein LOC126910976 n=1 Tax=Spodoptera frugiperda TaxID=7108 RepID=A0A9R0EUL8_SPOFR|nr:uncharacterized protein LOC126910976 [Spodoptera frugiperda]